MTNAYNFFVFSSRRQPPLLVWRWVIGLRAYTVIPLYLLCLWRTYKPKILSMIYFLWVHSQLRKKAGMLSVWRGKAFLQNVNSSLTMSQFWQSFVVIYVGCIFVGCIEWIPIIANTILDAASSLTILKWTPRYRVWFAFWMRTGKNCAEIKDVCAKRTHLTSPWNIVRPCCKDKVLERTPRCRPEFVPGMPGRSKLEQRCVGHDEREWKEAPEEGITWNP